MEHNQTKEIFMTASSSVFTSVCFAANTALSIICVFNRDLRRKHPFTLTILMSSCALLFSLQMGCFELLYQVAIGRSGLWVEAKRCVKHAHPLLALIFSLYSGRILLLHSLQQIVSVFAPNLLRAYWNRRRSWWLCFYVLMAEALTTSTLFIYSSNRSQFNVLNLCRVSHLLRIAAIAALLYQLMAICVVSLVINTFIVLLLLRQLFTVNRSMRRGFADVSRHDLCLRKVRMSFWLAFATCLHLGLSVGHYTAYRDRPDDANVKHVTLIDFLASLAATLVVASVFINKDFCVVFDEFFFGAKARMRKCVQMAITHANPKRRRYVMDCSSL